MHLVVKVSLHAPSFISVNVKYSTINFKEVLLNSDLPEGYLKFKSLYIAPWFVFHCQLKLD